MPRYRVVRTCYAANRYMPADEFVELSAEQAAEAGDHLVEVDEHGEPVVKAEAEPAKKAGKAAA